MSATYLWIVDSGASDDEIRRGVDAALEVFARWGLTPEHCARQMQALAEGDAYGERGIAAWREAEAAALAACCAGWVRIPAGAHLELEGQR
ncbi:hypothetical protein [Azohydromonas sp.]|uniref:hypothetical protein n=1 Tax=Azohydromonas sp. TaxID=1872666 RepID=UPI002B739224|nr:hypothetical protein [Azohydromonas sp.]HMM87060.1 hypothetical protein [Azohydromonas sp.]